MLFSLCLIGEMALVAYCFMYMPWGLPAIIALSDENQRIEHEVQKLSSQVTSLDRQVDDWQMYPFYTERYAREQLHMARPDETIYLID